jgi:phosphoglycolate phosphatase-like HAD superfamily hydrolase
MTNNYLLSHHNKEIITFDEWKNAECGNVVEFAYKYGILSRDNMIIEKENEIKEMYRKTFAECVKDGNNLPTIYEGVLELLKFIKEKGKKICIVSSHPLEQLKAEIKRYGIAEDTFDQIIGESISKNFDLERISIFMDHLPMKCMYMGDCSQDIKYSKLAGYGAHISITHGYQTRNQLEAVTPTIIVDSIPEFLDILKNEL